MRKNKMMRLASGLLVAVLLTTSMISGTFAKYVSTATGSDTARVAKWSIEVNDDEIATDLPTTIEFNAFDTVKGFGDGDETADDADVADGYIIAPGTSGEFILTVENSSEVSAAYAIDLAVTNNTPAIPLEFKIGTGEWTSDINSLESQLTGQLKLGGTLNAEHTVQWRWAFEQTNVTEGDSVDTGLGIDAREALEDSVDSTLAPQVTIAATITVTQMN